MNCDLWRCEHHKSEFALFFIKLVTISENLKETKNLFFVIFPNKPISSHLQDSNSTSYLSSPGSAFIYCVLLYGHQIIVNFEHKEIVRFYQTFSDRMPQLAW